jgi:rod shape-determining protein MreD
MMLRVLPALTLLFVALLAVLPFGADEEAVRYAIRFLPLMVVHYWSARRPGLLPVPYIFGIGLAIDVVTHDPLGYSALLALAVAGLAPLEFWLTGRSTAAGRALVFALAMVMAAGLAWMIAIIYTGTKPDARPYLLAALATLPMYPMMALALMSIDRLWETPRAQLFVRGN